MKVEKLNNKITLSFTEQEAKSLGLSEEKDYTIKHSEHGFEVRESADLEKELLAKIEGLLFTERTEWVLENVLPHDELMLLTKLVKTGKIKKFKSSEKYKRHVYVTEKEFEKLSRGERLAPPKPLPPKQAQGAQASPQGPARPALPNPLRKTHQSYSSQPFKPALQVTTQNAGKALETLEREGYAKAKDFNEMLAISSKHSAELKDGRIMGLKGFNGDYYAVKKEAFEDASKAVLEALSGKEKSVEELAKGLKAPEEKCETVLVFLNEQGLVYEKSKNVYKRID